MAGPAQEFPTHLHSGVLVLQARSKRTQSTLSRVFSEHGSRTSELGNTLAAEVEAPEVAPLVSLLSQSLSAREIDECSGGFAASELEVDRVVERPLREIIAEVQGHWLWELIENNRLTCHFQPIVSVQGELEIMAYECLLRANDVRDREISAGRILRAARDAKILPIVDTAAHLTAIQNATAYEIEEPIFINVSPLSVIDPLYDSRPVIAAARRSGFPARHFVFEITESETLDDFAPFLALARRFRRIGVRLALDDLGAGYASLNLLPELEPDFIKLDMELIRGIDTNRSKASIVTKLVELAKELEIPTIAEGVETHEQWDWIRDAGVDWAQGYLMARPGVPPPRLGNGAAAPVSRSAVPPLLDLYLVQARRRLADLTAMLVSDGRSSEAVAAGSLQELEGSLEVLEILKGKVTGSGGRSATEAVLVISSTGGIQYHSPLKEPLGYDNGRLVDHDLFSLIHPADLPNVVSAFDRGLRQPSSAILTAARFADANGRWVEMNLRGYTKLWEGAVGGFVLWLSEADAAPAYVVRTQAT